MSDENQRQKTPEEIRADIEQLSHVEMARLVRFARVGHPYFSKDYYEHFMAVFNEKGGMTPQISKEIGWTR